MKPIFRVLLLGSSRIHLLKEVVQSIRRVAPPWRTSVWIWLDMPKWMSPATMPMRSRYLLHKYVRDLENNSRRISFHSIAFGHHVGTRGLWLAALSMSRPQLILEDDVVLLPGAYQWYTYVMHHMSNNTHILGASFSTQTLVARREAVRSKNTLNETGPYTYPLPGSHGFIINPLNQGLFIEFVDQRSGCQLLIDGLQTSLWYREFLNRKLVHERMWTQEMVAFAYWHNKTTLYPPTRYPFAYHCATDHGRDTPHKLCKQTMNNATLRRPLQLDARIQPRHLSWDAVPYRVWSPLKPPKKPDKKLGCYPPPPPPPPPPPSPPSPPPGWMCVWLHRRC